MKNQNENQPAFQMSETNQQSMSQDTISNINFIKTSQSKKGKSPSISIQFEAKSNQATVSASVEELVMKVNKAKENNQELKEQIRNKIAQLLQDFLPQENIDESLNQLLSHLSKISENNIDQIDPEATYKNDIQNFLKSGRSNYNAIQNAFRTIINAYFRESFLKIQELETQINHLINPQNFNRLKGRFFFIVRDFVNCISQEAVQSNQLIDMKIEGDQEGNIYFLDNYKSKTYRFGVQLNSRGDLYIGTFHGKIKFGIGFHYPKYESEEFSSFYFGEFENKRHGMGIRTYEKGKQKYYGEFVNDLKQGK